MKNIPVNNINSAIFSQFNQGMYPMIVLNSEACASDHIHRLSMYRSQIDLSEIGTWKAGDSLLQRSHL